MPRNFPPSWSPPERTPLEEAAIIQANLDLSYANASYANGPANQHAYALDSEYADFQRDPLVDVPIRVDHLEVESSDSEADCDGDEDEEWTLANAAARSLLPQRPEVSNPFQNTVEATPTTTELERVDEDAADDADEKEDEPIQPGYPKLDLYAPSSPVPHVKYVYSSPLESEEDSETEGDSSGGEFTDGEDSGAEELEDEVVVDSQDDLDGYERSQLFESQFPYPQASMKKFEDILSASELENTFVPLQRDSPPRGPKLLLPEKLTLYARGRPLLPSHFFRLFFTKAVFSMLAINTNLYATFKGAGAPGKRPWEAVTAEDLEIWVAILVYFGIHKMAKDQDHWKLSERQKHLPLTYMSCNRFYQISRYFHVSDYRTDTSGANWWRKLNPLADWLLHAFAKYVQPPQNVAVDEMMIRYTGNSKETVKMKSKPIKEGYKSWALAFSGYTWTFMFYSRTSGTANLAAHVKMAATQAMVLQLAERLPYQHLQFTIIMDNLFSTPRLFYQLWKRKIGASGTCKPMLIKRLFPHVLKVAPTKLIPTPAPFTAHTALRMSKWPIPEDFQPELPSAGVSLPPKPPKAPPKPPKALRNTTAQKEAPAIIPLPPAHTEDAALLKKQAAIQKASKGKVAIKVVKQAWGTLTSARDPLYLCVLALCWVDNSIVTLLTTVHNGQGWNLKLRRAPRALKIQAKNAPNTIARQAFRLTGDPTQDWKAILPVPSVINHYNRYMNGVDLADQYRKTYNVQQAHRRSWLPLWYWLLDVSLINAFLLWKWYLNASKFARNTYDSKKLHKEFLESVVTGLLRDKQPLQPKTRADYHSPPPPSDIVPTERHFWLQLQSKERRACRICATNRLNTLKRERDGGVPLAQRTLQQKDKAPRSRWICALCMVPLCRKSSDDDGDCWRQYHTVVEEEKEEELSDLGSEEDYFLLSFTSEGSPL